MAFPHFYPDSHDILKPRSTDHEVSSLVAETRRFLEEHPVKRTAKLCQTGFNYGTSAAALLCAVPTAKLVSFDLGEHDYVKPAGEEIEKLFPGGRHELILGDSQQEGVMGTGASIL